MAASWTLRAISRVAAPYSSTAEVMTVLMSLTRSITSVTPRISCTTSLVAA
jgi:hypothetical protein